MTRAAAPLTRRHQAVLRQMAGLLIPEGGAFPEGGAGPAGLANARALAAALPRLENWFLRVTLDLFDLWGLVQTGDAFRNMTPHQADRYLRSWETSRVPVAPPLFAFLRAYVLLCVYEEPRYMRSLGGYALGLPKDRP